MNEQIAKEVITWLQSAREAVATQAPLLADEIVRWAIVDSSLGLALSGLLGYVLYRALRWCHTEYRTALAARRDEIGYVVGGSIGGAIAGFILVILVCSATAGLAKALTAPRLVVLEHVGRFIR